MAQVGLGVKSNTSLLPWEPYVNTCTSSRPWEMSRSPRKPG